MAAKKDCEFYVVVYLVSRRSTTRTWIFCFITLINCATEYFILYTPNVSMSFIIMRPISLLFIFTIFLHSYCFASNEIWIAVDTSKLKLSIMQNDKTKLVFDNISIGRFGASQSRMKGDNQTPLGTFRISWIKPHSRFYRFFGIDYPNRDSADLALTEGRITQEIWKSIIDGIDNNGIAPQDTPLGGYLGIHGVGRGDLAVHSRFNWTNGCIALTNTQIDQLSPWLKPGMRVVID
jgi:hypothetical protein